MSDRHRFKPYLNTPEQPTLFFLNMRRFARAMIHLVGPVTLRGLENLPSGPFILAPNHRAHVDPPYLSLLTTRQPSFMAKQELFVGFVGWWVSRLGAFPVRRGEPDRAALRTAIDLLAAGYIVVIFPEGTRSPDRRLYPAEPGFGLVARQSGAPIVPVAIEGTERVLPKGSKTAHRSAVTITVGTPFSVADAVGGREAAKKDVLDIIGRYTMERIQALMTEPVPIADAPLPLSDND